MKGKSKITLSFGVESNYVSDFLVLHDIVNEKPPMDDSINVGAHLGSLLDLVLHYSQDSLESDEVNLTDRLRDTIAFYRDWKRETD